RARKEQIQEMVRILLGLSAIPQPDDAADAAALAVCHLNSAAGREVLDRLALPQQSLRAVRVAR
ncbi:MAG TPA: crossover junction endodeoxyribonuclease RuvC, partial [Chloroflexota bacterium]|nr:crossover junction endodeoxyribonuclease RuvC [Chloroflexota bacterium]